MLTLLEHYASPQGEGPNTGTMTQFVRFAGCNLRCPGWPCDTPQAIFPSMWRDEASKVSVAVLWEAVEEMVAETGARNVCFTGGEPLLQSNEDLLDLMETGIADGFTFEVFTNGTREIPTRMIDYATINMDWKLEGSGEAQHAPEQRLRNAGKLTSKDMIKFVCKDEDDFQEAYTLWESVLKGVRAQFWAGVAFGELTERALVELIKSYQLPWKLNVQVHKYIYSAEERYV